MYIAMASYNSKGFRQTSLRTMRKTIAPLIQAENKSPSSRPCQDTYSLTYATPSFLVHSTSPMKNVSFRIL